MSDVMEDLTSLLYYHVCSLTSNEIKLIDDQKSCGLKVYVSVNSLDDNKFSIHTRLSYTDPMQSRPCECQSKINELLCTNLNEILSESSDVKPRRVKIQNLHNITKTYDKNTAHFIDCSSKPIPQSTNSSSPMDDNVFSSFNTPSAESRMGFFLSEDKTTPSNRKTSRARDLFFIKSQKVSYDNSYNETPMISIETVVTKKDCTCEIVFKTFSIKMSDGKMEKFQRSFVRSILKCQHKDEFVSNEKSKEVNNKIIETKPTEMPIKRSLKKQNSWKIKLKKSSFKKTKPSIKITDAKIIESPIKGPTTSSPNAEFLKKITNISVVIEPWQTIDTFTIVDEDDILMIDEEGDNEKHIAFEMDDKNIDQRNYTKEIDPSTCDCRRRRLDLIVHYIIHQDSYSLKEMENFNENCHFKNCKVKISPQSILDTPGIRYRRASNASICSHKHCESILDKILRYELIKCYKERIITFIESKTFTEYQNELLKVLSSEPSPENMSIFLYVTRTIIRQIDDPCFLKNKNIERIFNFSEQYLNNYFLKEISQFRTLEGYILKYGEVE